MSIEEIIRYYQNPGKDLKSNKSLPPSDNVNAYINFLTIDDVIYRYIRNNFKPRDALTKVTAEAYNKKYRKNYGRKAFRGKTVLVRAGIDVPVDDNGHITGTERIRLAIPTIEELS
ncbi:MAG: phosphoglycerate kinase, partial [Deltaproteobacteria bacterium]|nr:phosphoglycerate kinase [Deltaproteobacteria bacterium]